MVTAMTPVNMTTFIVLNPTANLSPDIKALGAINTDVAQSPTAQIKEMSCEDLRRTIWTINGMSHNGRLMAAQNPIVFNENPFYAKAKNLTNTFSRASTSGMAKDAVLAIPKPCTLKEATVVAYKSALRKVFSSSLLALLK